MPSNRAVLRVNMRARDREIAEAKKKPKIELGEVKLLKKSKCPFCGFETNRNDDYVVTCKKCNVTLHLECFRFNNNTCTTFACSSNYFHINAPKDKCPICKKKVDDNDDLVFCRRCRFNDPTPIPQHKNCFENRNLCGIPTCNANIAFVYYLSLDAVYKADARETLLCVNCDKRIELFLQDIAVSCKKCNAPAHWECTRNGKRQCQQPGCYSWKYWRIDDRGRAEKKSAMKPKTCSWCNEKIMNGQKLVMCNTCHAGTKSQAQHLKCFNARGSCELGKCNGKYYGYYDPKHPSVTNGHYKASSEKSL